MQFWCESELSYYVLHQNCLKKVIERGMKIMSIFGIIIGVILLIVLALRGWNVIVASLISSLVVIVFSGAPLYATFYEAYMTGFSNWAGRFFLMLAAGAVFAKVMEVSGAAQSISNSIMKITGEDNLLVLFFGLWLVATILVYGGISTWVIVYVMMPIMYPIFKKLNLPWTTAYAVFGYILYSRMADFTFRFNISPYSRICFYLLGFKEEAKTGDWIYKT